jgi:argininosuccinate lyase
MKTWGRRFAARREDPRLEAFNASIREDRFLAAYEIEASLGYARALRRAGVLTAGESSRIAAGLAAVGGRIERGEDLAAYEDIHSAVELLLIEEIGEPGKKLHTGRSRNEQVVTDERLYLKDRLPRLMMLLTSCQRAAVRLAERHADVVMPGYTHLRQAQGVLFAHYIMSLFWPLQRAKARLSDALTRIDVLPLGSGALAGTTAPIDRDLLGRDLGFSSVSENSMDAVADRSFILEPLSVLLILLVDISRFAEDFIIFSSREFGFLELDDAITTSSSLMPQKKNPDFFELLRAGAGRLFGDFSRLAMTLKGLPSTYNKDLQDDKVPLGRGVEETIRILEVLHETLGRIRPNRTGIALKFDSFLFATDLVDYLADRGVPFREAHGLVGEIVRFAEEKTAPLGGLSLSELRGFHAAFGADVFEVFDPGHSVRLKRSTGSTHPAEVKRQIRKARRLLRLAE